MTPWPTTQNTMQETQYNENRRAFKALQQALTFKRHLAQHSKHKVWNTNKYTKWHYWAIRQIRQSEHSWSLNTEKCKVVCLKLWLLVPWAWGDKVDCSIKNIRAWVGWCWWPGEVLMAGVSLALGVGAGRVNGRNSNNLFFLDASHVCPLCPLPPTALLEVSSTLS